MLHTCNVKSIKTQHHYIDHKYVFMLLWTIFSIGFHLGSPNENSNFPIEKKCKENLGKIVKYDPFSLQPNKQLHTHTRSQRFFLGIFFFFYLFWNLKKKQVGGLGGGMSSPFFPVDVLFNIDWWMSTSSRDFQKSIFPRNFQGFSRSFP